MRRWNAGTAVQCCRPTPARIRLVRAGQHGLACPARVSLRAWRWPMSSSHRGLGLRGRRTEQAALDRLLTEVRAGQSRVLVLRGEAGVGKTVLLDYVQERAPECRVVRAAGVESEMELPFAVLHQLCAPLLNSLARLPGPQGDALSTAFGLGAGAAPDRFIVSLAVLGLLSVVAEERPLVCLVDDAQWLDRASAQALAFVARRLLAESVAMIFSLREPSEVRELTGLPELVLIGLSDADARALLAGYVTAVLNNGLGRYPAALAGARRACEHDDLGYFNWSLAELVEAGVRSGAVEEAAATLQKLEGRTRASGTDWALGVLARSKALLSDDAAAESLYHEAIERLERGGIVIHLARAHLVYGEWLRRVNRRHDGREHLRIAYQTFSGIGAEAFAERTRGELLATGEVVRKRTVETGNVLTAQESQIVRLAADRHTNPKIASQLFISPRTVEYHLRKVFTKLGVSSRRELPAALRQLEGAMSPP